MFCLILTEIKRKGRKERERGKRNMTNTRPRQSYIASTHTHTYSYANQVFHFTGSINPAAHKAALLVFSFFVYTV